MTINESPIFLDRFGTRHSTPTCSEFHAHGNHPNPNNSMPATLIPADSPGCADCMD